MLDFQPNAVHAGLYAAPEPRLLRGRGRRPRDPGALQHRRRRQAARRRAAPTSRSSTSTTSGSPASAGLDIVAVAAIVQRPLASVIAADRDEIRTPADLEGKTDRRHRRPLRRRGARHDPGRGRRRSRTRSSARRSASSPSRCWRPGKIDAATAFWNAEGVELKRQGIPTREFRVDEFGAPRYPELVAGHARGQRRGRPGGPCSAGSWPASSAATRSSEPIRSPRLEDLLGSTSGLDADAQREQLAALVDAEAFSLEPERRRDLGARPREHPGLDPVGARDRPARHRGPIARRGLRPATASCLGARGGRGYDRC